MKMSQEKRNFNRVYFKAFTGIMNYFNGLGILGILSFFALASAQTVRAMQEPGVNDDRKLSAVVCVDQNTFIAVGSGGIILRSSNRGIYWSESEGGTKLPLSGISFFNLKKGIVVGDSGLILLTTDGGITWEPQVSGTDIALRSVSFGDGNHVLAVGKRGTILGSRDGGESWITLHSGTLFSLSFIKHLDSTTAIAVGIEGTILRTSDGGNTWSHSFSATLNDLHCVAFVDHETGLAVGDNQTVLLTTDGGAHWSPQVNEAATSLRGVSWVDSSSAILVGMDGSILRSTDAGVNWKRVQGSPKPLFGISISNRNNGIAVGEAQTILYTMNGGSQWSASPQDAGIAFFKKQEPVEAKSLPDSSQAKQPMAAAQLPFAKTEELTRPATQPSIEKQIGMDQTRQVKWRPFDMGTMGFQLLTGAAGGTIIGLFGSSLLSGQGGVIIGSLFGIGVGYPIGVYFGGEMKGGNGRFLETMWVGPGILVAGGLIALALPPVGIFIAVLAPVVGPIFGYHISASTLYDSQQSALIRINSQGKIMIGNASWKITHPLNPFSSSHVQMNLITITI